MTIPYSAASIGVGRRPEDRTQPGGDAPATGTARKARMLRKYRIMAELADGSIQDSENIGPAIPAFECAFSAFARGTLIRTPQGQVAVEDLMPGCEIDTAEYGPQKLIWIGSMTMVPNVAGVPAPTCRVTRIMPDAFGMERPMTNLMAGPGARLLSRPANLRDSFGGDRVLSPVRDLADGVNVVEITPPAAITVYHLCLQQHATITAGGLDFETFHPGIGFERQMGAQMLDLFLSFFPHIRAPGDFGPLAHLRLPFSWGGQIDAA
jgi:hypothetical protein